VSNILSLITNSLSHTRQRSPNLPNYITACKTYVKGLKPSPQKRKRESTGRFAGLYTKRRRDKSRMHTRHKSSHIDSLRAVGKSTGKRKSKPGCLIFASKLGEDLRGAANSKPHNRPSVSEKSQHLDPEKKTPSLSISLALSRKYAGST
jgi:hypothetical protein